MRITVVTTGRWDYGYLYWILKEIQQEPCFELSIIAPQNHHFINELRQEFGVMVNEAVKVYSINSYGNFYTDCLELYEHINSELVVLLGDRYETHAAATSAMLKSIPIAHIHGGEVTIGAFDNKIRNSITEFALYHFASHPEYAKNIVKIAETQNNIFVTGSPGLDWIHKANLKTKAELEQELKISLSMPYVVACFHPVTMEPENTSKHVNEFLAALDETGYRIFIAMPNTDPGHIQIRRFIRDYCNDKEKWYVFESITHIDFLALMKHALVMVGNSSSGIIEAASFSLPVVNIGSRQEGRIKSENVVDCDCTKNDIIQAIEKSINHTWKTVDNPYGNGNSSHEIVQIIKEKVFE